MTLDEKLKNFSPEIKLFSELNEPAVKNIMPKEFRMKIAGQEEFLNHSVLTTGFDSYMRNQMNKTK